MLQTPSRFTVCCTFFLVNTERETSDQRFTRELSYVASDGRKHDSVLPSSCIRPWSVPGSKPVEITGWTIGGAASLAGDPYFGEHPEKRSLGCQVWRPVRTGWLYGEGWYQFIGANHFPLADAYAAVEEADRIVAQPGDVVGFGFEFLSQANLTKVIPGASEGGMTGSFRVEERGDTLCFNDAKMSCDISFTCTFKRTVDIDLEASIAVSMTQGEFKGWLVTQTFVRFFLGCVKADFCN